MTEEQIIDIWGVFKEYIDKKQLEIVAEKYVDLLADYGTGDDVFVASLGSSNSLDDAINYYLDADEDEDDEDDEEDY
jgi:predicted subunit of tRNA(5-methylaminomethyl-2-thiouridylate) methyltransferase